MARRFRGSPGATRCVAPLGRVGTCRLSERPLGGYPPNVRRDKQRSRHERTLVVVAATCWQQRTFCAGAYAVECFFAREPPGAFSVPCKHSRESAASGNAPGMHGSSSNWTCCAFAASHEQRSRERRNLPLARRFCQSVVRQESRFERLARRHRFEQVNATNLHGTSPRQRLWWLSVRGTVTCSLGDSEEQSRPTRPQHPTACRSVARRLRRLGSARRVASRCWNRKARGRVSGRTLGRPNHSHRNCTGVGHERTTHPPRVPTHASRHIGGSSERDDYPERTRA